MLLTASFALNTVLIRYLSGGFTILQQVALRAAAAFGIALILFGRGIRWRRLARLGRREWLVIAIRAVLLYVVGTTLFSQGATMTLVADVSFIAALPLVAVLGLALRRVPVTRRRVCYVCGTVVGTVAISLSGSPSGALISWNRGDLVTLAAVLAIAVSYLGRSWHRAGLDNRELTTLMLGIGAICVAAGCFAFGQATPHLSHSASPTLLWAAIGLAGALNMLNVFLMNYGFEHVDAVRAGNLLALESVWGLIFGFAFYDQRPTPRELLGGAVIAACAVGLNRAPDPVDDRSAERGPRPQSSNTGT